MIILVIQRNVKNIQVIRRIHQKRIKYAETCEKYARIHIFQYVMGFRAICTSNRDIGCMSVLGASYNIQFQLSTQKRDNTTIDKKVYGMQASHGGNGVGNQGGHSGKGLNQ